MGLPWSTAETPEQRSWTRLGGHGFPRRVCVRDPAEPPGAGPPASTRRITKNPALGEEPVTGFVVKWAIETTPLVSNSEGTRMRLWRHERTLRVVVSGSRWPLPHYDW